MAGKVSQEVEEQARTKVRVQLTLAIATGETETHARGEKDYFLSMSIGIKPKLCPTGRPNIMQARAESCAALLHGGIWHTDARGFSISDIAWLNTQLRTWAGPAERSRMLFYKIKYIVNGNAACELDKVRR